MSKTETLAEVLCNLAGTDPNHEPTWQAALVEADAQLTDPVLSLNWEDEA